MCCCKFVVDVFVVSFHNVFCVDECCNCVHSCIAALVLSLKMLLGCSITWGCLNGIVLSFLCSFW